MRKLNRPYLIGIIIIVLVVASLVLVDKGRCEVTPVASKQYGPLTYVVAIDKECDGFTIDAAAARWMPRLAAECKTRYHHLIGPTGKEPALIGTTYTMPTEQVMHMMLRKYLMIIIH